MKHVPKVFLKATTLSLFILLITGFVAYRAGVFPSSASTSTFLEAGLAFQAISARDTLPPADSLRIPVKADSVHSNPRLMSSSKSMILYSPVPGDTVPDSLLTRKHIMYSSKSGMIIPGDKYIIKEPLDSAQQLKKKRKKAKKQRNRKP